MATDNSTLRRYHGTHSLSVLSSPAQRGTASLPLHSASVHITGFADLVNPNPWRFDLPERRDKEKDDPSHDYLSPKKLVELTGESNLHKVNYLEFSINTFQNSLGNFGTYIPNLTQLRLVNSLVPCVRDLGSCLGRVEVLWLPRCKLKDLDGLPALSSLRELYLAFNEVADISLITMLSSLELLDLESNNLSELDQIGYLSLCPSLASVTLDGNPICTLLAEKESGYRSAIREAVPQLKFLDDAPLIEEGAGEKDDHSSLSSHSTLFAVTEAGVESDWRIVQQSIKQSTTSLVQLDNESPDSIGATAVTNTSELSSRSLVRPQTAPPSGKVSPLLPTVDDCSELTHGLSQVICGNPARALKARRQHGLVSRSAVLLSPLSPSSTPPPAAQQLLSHLQQWKLNTVQEVPESSCSTSLEDDSSITVTRTTSVANLDHKGGGQVLRQTDHLSHSYSYSPRTPTPPKATSPLPPHMVARPHSVADFRHRRFRRTSTEPNTTQSRPNPLPAQQLFSHDTH